MEDKIDLVKILLCMFAGAFVPSDEVMSQELTAPIEYVAITATSTPYVMTLVSELPFSHDGKNYNSCLYVADNTPSIISQTVLGDGVDCPRKETFLMEMIPTVLNK